MSDKDKNGKKKVVISAVIAFAVICLLTGGIFAATKIFGGSDDKGQTESETAGDKSKPEKEDNTVTGQVQASDENTLRKQLSADGTAEITVTGDVRIKSTMKVNGRKTLKGGVTVSADYDMESASPILDISRGATLTVNGVNLDGGGLTSGILVEKNAKLRHESGEMKYFGGYGVTVYGEAEFFEDTSVSHVGEFAVHVMKDGKAEMTGGRYEDSGSCLLDIEKLGECTVNGDAVFDGAMSLLVRNMGTFLVYGGTFKNSQDDGIFSRGRLTMDYRGGGDGMIEVCDIHSKGIQALGAFRMVFHRVYVHDSAMCKASAGQNENAFNCSSAGARVDMSDCVIDVADPNDKDQAEACNVALSIGGDSGVRNVTIKGARYGLSLTDGSKVKVKNITIEGATMAVNLATTLRTERRKLTAEDVNIINCGSGIHLSGAGTEAAFSDVNIGDSTRMYNIRVEEEAKLDLTDAVVYGGTLTGQCVEIKNGAQIRIGKGTKILGTKDDMRSLVCLYNGATFIMDGGEITNKNAKTSASAVWISKYGKEGSKFIMNGGKLCNNKTQSQAGAVRIYDDCEFIMNGGQINGNEAKTQAAAVLVDPKGTFTMNGGSIHDNKAAGGRAGAVYVMQTATFNMNGGSIYENEAATSGGAVFMAGNMTLKGGTIRDNTAHSYGGGINIDEIKDDKTKKFYDAVFTMTGGRVSGNKCLMNAAGSGNGGGIIISNAKSAVITGGEISDNEADRYGGAIQALVGVTVKNVTFKGNKCGVSGENANGGAICLEAGSAKPDSMKAVVENVKFIQNESLTNCAGAVYNHGMSLTVTGSDFTRNKAVQQAGAVYQNVACTTVIKDSTFEGNEVTGKEGGTTYGGGAIKITKGAFTVKNSKFTGNKAKNMGGAVYVEATADKDSAVVNLTEGCVFDKNKVTGSVTVSDWSKINGGGGAVMQTGGTLNVTDGIFANNEAPSAGGAVLLKGTVTATFTVRNGKKDVDPEKEGNFFNNKVTETGTVDGRGGAICALSGSKLYINTDEDGNDVSGASEYTFNKNTAAREGGGIYSEGDVYMAKAAFNGNKSARLNGGALDVAGAGKTVKVTGTGFVKNTADGNNAGAIYIFTSKNSKITLEGCTFDSNSCGKIGINKGRGGAVFQNAASCVTDIKNCAFKNNTAGQFGGALFNQNGTVNITGDAVPQGKTSSEDEYKSVFEDNAAGRNGGAVHSVSTLSAENSLFKNNHCGKDETNGQSANGGALYLDNTLEGAGKMAEIDALKVGVTGCLFTKNGSETNCGGAVTNHGVYLTVSDTDFTSNKALQQAGAVYQNEACTTVIEGGTFKENEVTGKEGGTTYGGGAIKITKGMFTVNDAEFTGNKAKNKGGAMFIEGGEMTLNGTDAEKAVFDENKSIDRGGAIYMKGGTVNVTDYAFTGNMARRGGAIYTEGGANITLKGTDLSKAHFTGNQAKKQEGDTNSETCLAGAIFIYRDSGEFNLSGYKFEDNKAENGRNTARVESDVAGSTITGTRQREGENGWSEK